MFAHNSKMRAIITIVFVVSAAFFLKDERIVSTIMPSSPSLRTSWRDRQKLALDPDAHEIMMKEKNATAAGLVITAKRNESIAINDETSKLHAENKQLRQEKKNLLLTINEKDQKIVALNETIKSLTARSDKNKRTINEKDQKIVTLNEARKSPTSKSDKAEKESIDVVADNNPAEKNHKGTQCQVPPNAMKRHGAAWVQVEDYQVLKHPSGPSEYNHEKEMATRLGKYDHFNKLLGFDDDCEVLVFERLFPRVGGFIYPANHSFNRTLLQQQLESIFFTFEIEQIVPSEEFFMGLNNIFIGEEQNVTMFDYHSYKQMFNNTLNNDNKLRFNSTYNNLTRDRLYNVILESVDHNKNKKQ